MSRRSPAGASFPSRLAVRVACESAPFQLGETRRNCAILLTSKEIVNVYYDFFFKNEKCFAVCAGPLLDQFPCLPLI